MTNNIKRILAVTLSLLFLLSSLAACDTEEAGSENGSEADTEAGTDSRIPDFDYESADLSQYISLDSSEYKNNTVTLSTDYIISDQTVQEYIDDERFKNKAKTDGDTQITDQAVRYGDSAFIYYTGYLDGVAFDGGSNASDKDPYELSIGSGSFIDGFEDGLIGVVPSETSKDAPYELPLTFPKDYHSAELAGKSVIFKVWIEYVIQYTVPEFDDNYVKNTLKFDGTAEEYRDEVKQELQAEATAKAEDEALSAIISKLMDDATIKGYPEQSVDYWYAAYVDQYEYYMQYYSMYGYKFNSLDEFVTTYLGLKEGEDWKEKTVEFAKEMVVNALVHHIIAEQQGMTVTDEEFTETVKELAEYYSSESKKYTPDEIVEQLGEQSIRQNILFEEVEEYLLDNCTIEYKD